MIAFRNSFKKDRKATGIEEKDARGRYADIHSLRHTFAILLARSNVHPKVAQTLLRHSDIRMTMAIYTHVDHEEQAKALTSLPALDADEKRSGHHMVTTEVTFSASVAGKERQGGAQ
jgi:integrase